MIAFPHCSSLDPRHIRARCIRLEKCSFIKAERTIRLSDPETELDAPVRNTWEESILLILRPKVHNRRNPNTVGSPESPQNSRVPLSLSAQCLEKDHKTYHT